jgi:hypothetical protein
LERKKLSDLRPNPRNPRKKMNDPRREMLRQSLDEFGDLGCFVFNIQSNLLAGGHQRTNVLPPDADIIITQRYDQPTRTGTVAEGHVLIAGEKFKYREVNWDEDKAKAANLAANKHSGEWDLPMVSEILLELDHANYDMNLTGYDGIDLEHLFTYSNETTSNSGSPSGEKDKNRKLSDRFLVPPFSVLDARQGYWQDRKREWLSLGIQSELGRGGEGRGGDAAAPGGSPRPACKT